MNFARIGYDKSFNEEKMMCNFNRHTAAKFLYVPKGVISEAATVVKMQINVDGKTEKNVEPV